MIYKNIFDTHSHYDDEAFDSDRDELILSLKDKGVVGVVSCGCDVPSTAANRDLAHKFDDFYFAAGFHPENLEEYGIDDLSLLDEYLSDEKCVAVGEIGLDYHWDIPKDKQMEVVKSQLKLANDLNMPVVFHDREAHGDSMELLRKYKPKGLLHCYSGSTEMLKEVLKLGMYISLGGVVTFKNSRVLKEVVKAIPLEHIVVETDCPYLAPTPHRGKRNSSAYLPLVI